MSELYRITDDYHLVRMWWRKHCHEKFTSRNVSFLMERLSWALDDRGLEWMRGVIDHRLAHRAEGRYL